MKRVFDICLAIMVLTLTSGLFLFAFFGIKLSSKGPVFYRATRIGKDQKPFIMYKFRSMHIGQGGSVITAHNDARIFWFGDLIRKLKIDELPQLINVLKGDMSFVGPRPEDAKIINEAYSGWMLETLSVRPGITSAGSLFYYSYCEKLIDEKNAEESYSNNVLPLKLAIELAYMKRENIFSDLMIILMTPAAVIGNLFGYALPVARKDMDNAKTWVDGKMFKRIL